VLFSERFDRFYRGMANANLRREFLELAHEKLTQVTGYCSAVAFLHASLLERLSLVETDHLQTVLAMRIEVARSLGLFRKALSVSKLCRAHYSKGNNGLPYLVPAHDGLPSIVRALIDENCFRDGTHVDLGAIGAPFLYACAESRLQKLRQYDAFNQAFEQRRIVIVDAAEQDAAHPNGFAIKQGQQIDHQLMDKIFRFFEEDHRSFRY
jgi:hypothetical protein